MAFRRLIFLQLNTTSWSGIFSAFATGHAPHALCLLRHCNLLCTARLNDRGGGKMKKLHKKEALWLAVEFWHNLTPCEH
jgi:hypothetical protein